MATSDQLSLAAKAALSPAEMADADALVREAGWNQVAADWRIFLELGTRLCGADRDAAASSRPPRRLPFGGRFAWISMVLVAGDYRRRGLATRLMRRAIDDLAAAGLVPVLDATPAGRAVYRALGFEDTWGFQRLSRRERRSMRAQLRRSRRRVIRPITDADWPALVRLRRRGVRRRPQRRAGAPARPPAGGRADRRARRPHRGLSARPRRPHRVAARPADRRGRRGRARAARARARCDRGAGLHRPRGRQDRGSRAGSKRAASRRSDRSPACCYGRSQRFDDAARTFAVVGPEFG